MFGLRRYPAHLTVETTSSCQLRCPVCPIPDDVDRKGNFPLDLFGTLLEQVHWRLDTMYFGWSGEPLLNKNVHAMVRLAADRGFKTHMNTNGMLVGRYAEQILDSGLDFIGIDLDGMDQETLAQYRVRGKWEDIAGGVERLTKLKRARGCATPTVSLQMIVMKQTEAQIDDFVKLGARLGADQVFLKSFNVDLGNWMTEADHRKMADQFLPTNPIYSRYVFEEQRLRVRPEILKAKCPEAHGGMTILQNGDAVLCCLDFKANHVIGNILKTPLAEIWRSDAYRKIRKAVDARSLDLCKTCTFPGVSKFNQTIKL